VIVPAPPQRARASTPGARRRAFAEHVGIDYSGAGPPDAGCSGLRVFRSVDGREAEEVRAPGAGGRRRWSRRALAEWLLARLGPAPSGSSAAGRGWREPGRVVVGIDHCFSFPVPWLEARDLSTWDAFLARFCEEWATDRESVARCRPARAYAGEVARFRLCEAWTSSAKSVFQFGMNGQVAASSHAGIPWLRRLRRELGAAVHFWPFDGWQVPPGKHAIAEVYPSIFRNRFPRDGRNADQQDAYAVAEWLRTRDAAGLLRSYFEPGLTPEEREIAKVEGWVLGIM